MPPPPGENSGARTIGTINERPDAAALNLAAPKRQRKGLIVDDSRMIRSLSRRILEEFGYQVAEAENGEEALARIKAQGMPDLILIDWNMPVMTGLQCVRALREIAGEAWPKIVFCTTVNEADAIHKGIDAGASEWIVKPFDKPAMQAKLEKIGAI